MPVDKLAQRLAAQQRHVAVADHDRAGDGADRLGDHADRVPGAELLVLVDDPRLRRDRGHLRRDLFPAMPDDDHQPGRVKLVGRRERVPEQGAAAQRVQHLGGAGLHALALAGGEDDDCGRGSFAHKKHLLGFRAEYLPGPSSPRTPLRGATEILFTRSSPAGYLPVAGGQRPEGIALQHGTAPCRRCRHGASASVRDGVCRTRIQRRARAAPDVPQGQDAARPAC